MMPFATRRRSGGVSEMHGGPDEDTLNRNTDDIYGGSGDGFIGSVDGREDFVDCGCLESPNAGAFDTDTALIDSNHRVV
jgi:hypothetical protein